MLQTPCSLPVQYKLTGQLVTKNFWSKLTLILPILTAHPFPEMISIIIPTFNEVRHLPKTLESIGQLQGKFELIVVDGGSTDGTLDLLAQQTGIRWIKTGRAERAGQMNAGARVARGDIFWFLHADTLVPPDSLTGIQTACRAVNTVGGSFRMAFDRPDFPYRILSLFTRINSRFWTFGDQGIFVKRAIFFKIGGFPRMPILEDLELQIRLRQQGQFIKVPATVITSARRYHQGGIRREFWRDVRVVVGYFLGFPIHFLKSWYSKLHG